MGKVVRLIFPDFCKTEHRLYHVIGRACSICVPDPYARFCLWNVKRCDWYPLAWIEDDQDWDDELQKIVCEDGDLISIPAMSGANFRGFGPGTKIVVEKLPDDVYERLMEAMATPGEFDRVWFEYENKNKLMDS